MSKPELKLYNTLTRQKEDFTPLDPKDVRMYVCGPTVYDYAHIGNARPIIVFDVLFRLLRHLYGEQHVTYVRNITDVDDKINARAAERGISIRDLTEKTFAQYQIDTHALNCLEPTYQPRATEYISKPDAPVDMIRIIKMLIERGHAYVAKEHVLFDVPSMKNYGLLSRRPMDEMIAGARVEVAPFKKNPADFVLWKPSTSDLPGWDSPWGRGRPGWHLECSAMAAALLGKEFDIHGGGIDLVFPHHENEIAQSCCAFGTKRMAQVFMHNGFLQMEGEKMSKSAGNFVTISELLTEWHGTRWPSDAIRFCMLRSHYRQPINWTLNGLEESVGILASWYEELGNSKASAIPHIIIEALSDDLNTPQLIAELHALHKQGNREGLASALQFLGLSCNRQALKRNVAVGAHLTVKIDMLVKERLAARTAKNFSESDRIRDELAKMGVAIRDNKDGTTTWEMT
jgi:cysteinyl-tRNA synthetase